MNLEDFQTGFESLLAEAARLLGAEVRPFQLSWELDQLLRPRLRPAGRAGIGGPFAVDLLRGGRRGHELEFGIQLHRLPVNDSELLLAEVEVPHELDLPDFWAVATGDYRRLYRELRQLVRQSQAGRVEPFIRPADRQRLWDNTIGFLRRDDAQLRRFDIPKKRGVLLIGQPGNGKTMACRWLSAECHRFGLEWQSVTVDRYEQARRDNELADLFQPTRPGIVLFDDFDTALRDRDSCDNIRDLQAFLTELDGVNTRSGVVFLFTSNLEPQQIDAALRRPGRIDLVIPFPKPNRETREQYIRDRWPDEVTAALTIGEVAAQTDGFSFADLEELRKLIILHYIDTGQVDWPRARAWFADRCPHNSPRRHIGFARTVDKDESHSATIVARLQ